MTVQVLPPGGVVSMTAEAADRLATFAEQIQDITE